MLDIGLSALVKDWGGFEELVARLHETGTVTVERNVTVIGKSGAPRQIDVLVRHRQDLYEHKVVIECKYWNQPIERLHVDALATTVREVEADRGVIFSTRGFQSGAIIQAKQDHIELFKVRELTDEEWGWPGRHVDLWLHVIATSVGNVQPAQGYWVGHPQLLPPPLNIMLGRDDVSGTQIRAHNRSEKTAEELIGQMVRDTSQQIYKPTPVQFEKGLFEGELRVLVNVNYEPPKPLQVLYPHGIIFIPKLGFQVGLLVKQSRIQIDRAQNFAFGLAVEDCIRNKVTAASRQSGSETTILSPLEPAVIPPGEEPFRNGSLLQVWMKGYTEFSNFAGMEPGKAVVKAAS